MSVQELLEDEDDEAFDVSCYSDSLNSDGQQDHQQNQQNLSPQRVEHKDHDIWQWEVLAWNRHKNVAGLNCLMNSNPPHLDNWISNGNSDIMK